MELMIGADPELFLMEKDQFVSGFDVIPGTKRAPFKVNKGAVQVDGMALEVNIEPASTDKEFANNLTAVLKALREMVPSEYDLTISPVAHFDDVYMAQQPRQAKILGCDPDFNAYTEDQNPAPEGDMNMRTAAGHIHLGWTQDQEPMNQDHFKACCDLAIQLDYYLGLHSVVHDKDTERVQMYGSPGSFRPKPYGMEYRVLSNYWLRYPDTMRDIFYNTKLAFDKITRYDFSAADEIIKRCGENYTANKIMESKNINHAYTVLELLGARR